MREQRPPNRTDCPSGNHTPVRFSSSSFGTQLLVAQLSDFGNDLTRVVLQVFRLCIAALYQLPNFGARIPSLGSLRHGAILVIRPRTVGPTQLAQTQGDAKGVPKIRTPWSDGRRWSPRHTIVGSLIRAVAVNGATPVDPQTGLAMLHSEWCNTSCRIGWDGRHPMGRTDSKKANNLSSFCSRREIASRAGC